MNLKLQIEIITHIIRAINKRQKAHTHTYTVKAESPLTERQKAHILKGKKPTLFLRQKAHFTKAVSPHAVKAASPHTVKAGSPHSLRQVVNK